MSTLFSDTLSGTAGASITSRNSDSGGSWAKHALGGSADVKLAAGGTAFSADSGPAIMVTDNTGLTDVEVEATVTVKTNGSGIPYAGIGVRMNASNAQWDTLGVNDGSVTTAFAYDTAGTPGGGDFTTNLPSTFKPLLAAGSHTLKLSAQGSGTALYRAFVNNREVSRIGRNQADSGRAGLITGGPVTSTTGAHFDSFQITDNFSRNQVQFVGDSLSYGAFYNDIGGLDNVGYENQWPQLLMNRVVTEGGDADWANLGASGKRLSEMFSDIASISTSQAIANSVPEAGAAFGWGAVSCRRAAAAKDVVVLEGGLNDFLIESVSAATAYSRLTSNVSALKVAGFYVIVMTIPHVEEGTHLVNTIPAGTNTIITAFNALIVANAAGAHAIANVDVDSRISTDTSNTTYRSVDADGVHWLAAAQQLVADVVYPHVALGLGLTVAITDVTAPAAGQRTLVGEALTIEFEVTGVIPDVSFDLSTDNGSTWTSVATGITNTGSYDLDLIQDYVTATAKVRVKSATDATVFAVSDAFVIATTDTSGGTGGGTSLVGIGSMPIRGARVGE
jgi:hypothetical protein